MTAVAARQARRAGIPLHAGEAVRFIVTSAGDKDVDSRVRILPLLRAGETYDEAYYIEQIQKAAATILEPLLGEPIAKILSLTPPPRRRRPQPPSNVIQPTFL